MGPNKRGQIFMSPVQRTAIYLIDNINRCVS